MQKSVGVLLIIFSCAGLGFGQSLRLTGRLRTLEMMKRMIVLLSGESRFGNASLCSAFYEAGGKLKEPFGSFLGEVSGKLSSLGGRNFESVYRECAQNYMKLLNIQKEEEELFFSLGSRLGYLDLEMQMKELLLYEEELTRRTEELRREMPAKKKVYESLGILGGILLAVLVW